jgi:hypothetical protein
VRVSLFLADYAQSDDKGKVNAIGLAWTNIQTPLPPFAVVLIVDIDWSETNEPHRVTCELLNDDGQPVEVQGPVGAQPLRFEMQVEAGRLPRTIHGTAFRSALAVNVGGGMPLPAGRYQWRASVAGFEAATATESFVVNDLPQGPRPQPPAAES